VQCTMHSPTISTRKVMMCSSQLSRCNGKKTYRISSRTCWCSRSSLRRARTLCFLSLPRPFSKKQEEMRKDENRFEKQYPRICLFISDSVFSDFTWVAMRSSSSVGKSVSFGFSLAILSTCRCLLLGRSCLPARVCPWWCCQATSVQDPAVLKFGLHWARNAWYLWNPRVGCLP